MTVNSFMLVDTNVIVYALDASHQKNSGAKKFLKDHEYMLAIAQQNLLEAFRVLTHRKYSAPMTTEQAQKALDAFSQSCTVVCPSAVTYQLAREFTQKHRLVAADVFDAYLAATAVTNDIHVIATNNIKGFEKFEGLEVVNPFK